MSQSASNVHCKASCLKFQLSTITVSQLWNSNTLTDGQDSAWGSNRPGSVFQSFSSLIVRGRAGRAASPAHPAWGFCPRLVCKSCSNYKTKHNQENSGKQFALWWRLSKSTGATWNKRTPITFLFLSDGQQEKTHLRGEGSRLRMKWIPRKAETGYESGTLVTQRQQSSLTSSLHSSGFTLWYSAEEILGPFTLWGRHHLSWLLGLHQHKSRGSPGAPGTQTGQRTENPFLQQHSQSHHVYHPGQCQNSPYKSFSPPFHWLSQKLKTSRPPLGPTQLYGQWGNAKVSRDCPPSSLLDSCHDCL